MQLCVNSTIQSLFFSFEFETTSDEYISHETFCGIIIIIQVEQIPGKYCMPVLLSGSAGKTC